MSNRSRSTSWIKTTGLLAAAALAACSDSSVTNPTSRLAPGASADFAILLATPAAIIPGSDAGYFGNTILANESLRLTTEFWDNISSDNSGAAHCNVGYYASGTIVAGCLNEKAGSTANAGGYTYFWGDDGGVGAGRDASSFMFNGTMKFDVTLKGSYTFVSATVPAREQGWFEKTGTTYTFHPVADWTNRVLNTTTTIGPLAAGTNWGFYMATIVPQTNGCGGGAHPNFACSDATGSFTSTPQQHWALFANSTGSKFLVGGEDNILKLLGDLPNPDFHDSDYNDYIYSVTPVVTCQAGLTLGYWKNHTNKWVTYSTTTKVSSVFTNTGYPAGSFDPTLLQVLSFGGGSSIQDAKNLLLKQAVAALLNTTSLPAGASYPLTTAQVISEVNAALASANRETILAEASRLDGFNNLEINCPGIAG